MNVNPTFKSYWRFIRIKSADAEMKYDFSASIYRKYFKSNFGKGFSFFEKKTHECLFFFFYKLGIYTNVILGIVTVSEDYLAAKIKEKNRQASRNKIKTQYTFG